MTLATLPRAPSLPPSPARAKVTAAAAALQRAIDDLYAEDRERAAQRERARAENDAKAARFLRLAKARQATRELRIEVDRRWFWDFAGEAVHLLGEFASEANKRGERTRADAINSRVDAFCAALNKIQEREARGASR